MRIRIMRIRIDRILILILFLFTLVYYIFLNTIAFADNANQSAKLGEYVITINELPDNTAPKYEDITYDFVSFWQLPLWVQLAYISFTILTVIALIKIFPFIFGRLKHALENPKTRKIFNFIQRNPGATIAELSEEQKINRGTLKYHLSQLLSSNKIIFIKKGKFSRLFYNKSSPVDKESIISRYLKNENSCRILFKIMDNPGISNQELSDGFELAKSTTHEYLKNFSDDGLIEFRQDGKFKRYYLRQDARMIMLRYRPL